MKLKLSDLWSQGTIPSNLIQIGWAVKENKRADYVTDLNKIQIQNSKPPPHIIF